MSSEKPNPYLSTAAHQQQGHKRKFRNEGPAKSKRTKMLGAAASLPMGKEAPPKDQTETNIDLYLYGNYRNYYEARRGNVDPHDGRLDLLDASLFKGKRVLDIGCNSGNITIMIGLQYQPTHILGVDLDEVLINKAEKQLRTVHSLRNPDGNDQVDVLLQYMYFPRALATMHGFMPMSVPPNYKGTEFPYNVKFQTTDWMTTKNPKKADYDTVLALSLTKWIHIHHGDEGMKAFFKKVYQVLKPGGSFIVEPQAYETYQRRAKLSDDLKEKFESIEFKPDQFHDYLMNEVGFTKFTDFGSSGEKFKGFNRPMHVYTK